MSELETLVHLQEFDTRIAGLDAEAGRLPRQIEALHASVAEGRKTLEAGKARSDATRKELRAKEKDLDDISVKRSRSEARLYEVKTNTEYSAVLAEIETIKRQKAQAEEEMLALMERQETLAVDIRDAEARLKAREEQARGEEASLRAKLTAVEGELEVVRTERASLARELPRGVLGDYERIMRARGGVGIVPVTSVGVCGGCRMTIRPQAVQELRGGTLLHCESCGRFLYWAE